MFLRRRERKPDIAYDPARMQPVLRASICTGEQAAGFRDKETGKFIEAMLIRDRAGLTEFLRLYGLREEQLKKEW